jgi:predicted metal-dependent HD superfamily phosphohydrolase
MDRQWLRWRSFWGACGARGDAGRFFEELDVRYREPHRFYHGWPHILACLDELDSARQLCGSPPAVELALWYHDAVYDPRARDNEARSAALARESADAMGIAEAAAAEAEALVLLTTHAAGLPKDAGAAADAAVILDIDLAILGSSPPAFASYEKAIRAEYSFLPENEYRQGRARVLQSFLDRPRIYLTDLYRERLELRARENIRGSLDALAGQPR